MLLTGDFKCMSDAEIAGVKFKSGNFYHIDDANIGRVMLLTSKFVGVRLMAEGKQAKKLTPAMLKKFRIFAK